MKIILKSLLYVFLVTSFGGTFGEGIVFEHATWAEILKKSKAVNKPIFVDFYATWCGPCKMMTRDVFTQAGVGDFFNKNFISYKVDAEKDEAELVGSVNLEAYPTLGFFDPNGKLMYKHVGAMDADKLIGLGTFMASFPSLKANVSSGKATHEQILSYLTIAREADPDTFNKLAPDLVKGFSLADLEKADPWKIYTLHVTDMKSDYFQTVIKNAATLNKAHDDYTSYVNDVMGKYFLEMIATSNLKGLDLYKANLQEVYRQISEKAFDYQYFDYWINSEYYLEKKQMDSYAKYLVLWVDKYLQEDWSKLTSSAEALSSAMPDAANKAKALTWAQKAVSLEKNKETMYNLARVYENMGQKAMAQSTAKEILNFQLEEDEKEFVSGYIEKLK